MAAGLPPRPALVGRERELAELTALLDRTGPAGRGLVLSGAPGIGKSSLLTGFADVVDADRLVLRCTGAAFEVDMPFAGLHQLLRPVLSTVDSLPGPQANALRAAFGLIDTEVDRFLVGMAVLGLLTDAAAEQPVVVLVDDTQWLDRPTRDTVLFVLRRLHHDRITAVVAVRDGDEIAFGAPERPVLRLDPLSTADGRRLLGQAAGQMPASVVERLLAEAAGNPLALVELPALLSPGMLRGDLRLPAYLPCGERLRSAFSASVAELSPAGRTLLLVAAANDGSDMKTVLAAGRVLGVDESALTSVEKSGVATVRHGDVVFRHPMTKMAIYAAAGFAERQSTHRALAEALAGQPHRWAWHLAQVADGTDDEVAAILAEYVAGPDSDGGLAQAADRLECAAELTADPSSQVRYRLDAASCAWQAGQLARAKSLLASGTRGVDDPVLSARAALLRGGIMVVEGSPRAATQIVQRAVGELPAGEPVLASRLLAVAASSAVSCGDVERLPSIVDAADRLPLPADHPVRPFFGALRRMSRGEPPALSTSDSDRVVETALRYAGHREPEHAGWLPILPLCVSRMSDYAREAYLRTLESLRRRGASGLLPLAVAQLLAVDSLAGRWESVVPAGTEALELAERTGQVVTGAYLRALLAMVSAARGAEDETRALVERSWEVAIPNGVVGTVALGYWALGLSALARGDLDTALRQYREIVTPGRGGHHVMVALLATPDLVEVYVRRGQYEAARRALDQASWWSTNAFVPHLHSALLRARAIVAGTDEARETQFREAVRVAASPFDLARAELACGEWLRRGRRIQEARQHLHAAATGFQRLGATPWYEQARSELRASGAGQQSGHPVVSTVTGNLSPQENRIAELAASGMTNREIAERIFLSPRTVRYHLSKIFPKLGVTSRHQLRNAGFDQ